MSDAFPTPGLLSVHEIAKLARAKGLVVHLVTKLNGKRFVRFLDPVSTELHTHPTRYVGLSLYEAKLHLDRLAVPSRSPRRQRS